MSACTQSSAPACVTKTDLEVVEAGLEALAKEHAQEAAAAVWWWCMSEHPPSCPSSPLPKQAPDHISSLVLGGGHQAVHLVLEGRVHEGRPRVRALAQRAGLPICVVSFM